MDETYEKVHNNNPTKGIIRNPSSQNTQNKQNTQNGTNLWLDIVDGVIEETVFNTLKKYTPITYSNAKWGEQLFGENEKESDESKSLAQIMKENYGFYNLFSSTVSEVAGDELADKLPVDGYYNTLGDFLFIATGKRVTGSYLNGLFELSANTVDMSTSLFGVAKAIFSGE